MNAGSLSLHNIYICMPRPFLNRKVCNPPKMSGFKPFGMPACKNKYIKLQFDEYESIHLIGYKSLSQNAAAESMDVSRPTFTRIYNNALKKIARAFTEGLSIEIEGGNVDFEKEWYKCKKCYKLIEGLENHLRCKDCSSFGENELEILNK